MPERLAWLKDTLALTSQFVTLRSSSQHEAGVECVPGAAFLTSRRYELRWEGCSSCLSGLQELLYGKGVSFVWLRHGRQDQKQWGVVCEGEATKRQNEVSCQENHHTPKKPWLPRELVS